MVRIAQHTPDALRLLCFSLSAFYLALKTLELRISEISWLRDRPSVAAYLTYPHAHRRNIRLVLFTDISRA